MLGAAILVFGRRQLIATSSEFCRRLTVKSMDVVKEEKASLRAEAKLRLAAITTDEKRRQSEAVRTKIFDHAVFKASQRVSIFLSMDDEIQTLDILKKMLDSDKTVFIPRYSGKLGRMDMVRLMSWDDYVNLPTTRWNIKQPAIDDVRQDAIETGGLDLVIVPGLAFSKEGNRLGRGKGYYDAFLKRCHEVSGVKPYTLAVAFREQIVPKVPVTDCDVTIDEVICCD